MRRALAVAALLLASGCGSPAPRTPAPVAPPTNQPPPEPATAAPASLVGEWRVAAIDGKPIDTPVGLAVSIDARTIRFEPTCAGFIWRYQYAAGRLDAERSGTAAAGGTTPPVCAIALLPEHRALAAAFDAATAVARTPANGVEFTGGGRRVLLFSQ